MPMRLIFEHLVEKGMLLFNMEAKKTQHGGRRAGAGRKTSEDTHRLHCRSVYLTDDEWDKCYYDWTMGVTPSEYVRRLVQRDIRQRRQQEQQVRRDDTEQDDPT